ncbi:hypothetical protein HDV05_007006 [Chytridiales sp. JEL 0842]|nr:hypothetical protein HDV05_007006 [Chytridiales sp. JEL 0842]
MAWLSVVTLAVLGGDLYYYLYVHEPATPALTPEDFRNFPLKDVIPLTKDTSLFRFGAAVQDPKNTSPTNPPSTNMTVTAPSHIIVKDDSCQIARAYTPITYGNDHFDLVVKKYPDGSVSQLIHGLAVGERLPIRGPLKTFDYQPNMVKHLGMIAGGTGITPMYQLLKQILRDPNDSTSVSLVLGSQTDNDILLKQELDLLAKANPSRLKVKYVVQQADAKKWPGEIGLISDKSLKNFIPSPDSDSLILVCGPERMINYLAGPRPSEYEQGPLAGVLAKMGYKGQNVFKM